MFQGAAEFGGSLFFTRCEALLLGRGLGFPPTGLACRPLPISVAGMMAESITLSEVPQWSRFLSKRLCPHLLLTRLLASGFGDSEAVLQKGSRRSYYSRTRYSGVPEGNLFGGSRLLASNGSLIDREAILGGDDGGSWGGQLSSPSCP